MSPPRQPRLLLADGVELRPWRQDDAAGLALAYRDPLVRHYATTLVDDVREALGAVQRWSALWTAGDGAAWVLSDGSGTVLGAVRFGLLDARVALARVGYWLTAEARGAGLATAGLVATTAVVFRRFDWHRIELAHAVENERSCAVARRAGYAFEGVQRDAQRYPQDGRWSDEHLHARLATDG